MLRVKIYLPMYELQGDVYEMDVPDKEEYWNTFKDDLISKYEGDILVHLPGDDHYRRRNKPTPPKNWYPLEDITDFDTKKAENLKSTVNKDAMELKLTFNRKEFTIEEFKAELVSTTSEIDSLLEEMDSPEAIERGMTTTIYRNKMFNAYSASQITRLKEHPGITVK